MAAYIIRKEKQDQKADSEKQDENDMK
jgi:hypothetical protein